MIWVEDYMMRGLRHERLANGPDAYDCWNFVRLVQREQLARELPQVMISDGVVRRVLGDALLQQWRLRGAHEAPQDFDIVEMHRPGDLHVGVWSCIEGGGILHCNGTAGAPSWTPLLDAQDLFPKIRFWTCP